jgi:hypothetical protein
MCTSDICAEKVTQPPRGRDLECCSLRSKNRGLTRCSRSWIEPPVGSYGENCCLTSWRRLFEISTTFAAVAIGTTF